MTRNGVFVFLNVVNESFERYSREFLDLLGTLPLDRTFSGKINNQKYLDIRPWPFMLGNRVLVFGEVNVPNIHKCLIRRALT